MYQVRRIHIGKTSQLDALAHACGELYTQTLVFFWRTVRHKSIWLKPKHLMRLFTFSQLHVHAIDSDAIRLALRLLAERAQEKGTK